MHEIAPVTAAARGLIDAAEGQSVAAVTVTIGRGVDPEVSAVAWETAVQGTSLEKAVVQWQVDDDLLVCLDCSCHYPGSELDRCPACGGDGLPVETAPVAIVTTWAPARP